MDLIAFSLFHKGGFIMYILALLSIYVLAVVFYKAYQFAQARLFAPDFTSHVLESLRVGQVDSALTILNSTPNPVARVMRLAIEQARDRLWSKEHKQAEIERVGNSEIRQLESHLRGLDLAANVGPLLGLLGTVVGMVAAFSKLQQAGSRIDPSMLAGGIWEALLTTAGGLVVAIPALVAHYVIDGIVERVRSKMQESVTQIQALEGRIQAAELGETGELFAATTSTLKLLNPRYS